MKDGKIILYDANKGPLVMKKNPRNKCEKGKPTGIVRLQIDYEEIKQEVD